MARPQKERAVHPLAMRFEQARTRVDGDAHYDIGNDLYRRMLDERFDRIVSIGMFEHVGPKNYRSFMEVAHRCLNGGGKVL